MLTISIRMPTAYPDCFALTASTAKNISDLVTVRFSQRHIWMRDVVAAKSPREANPREPPALPVEWIERTK